MPTYFDESGDTGWHDEPPKRSADYFRLAAVWLPSRAEATACEESIRRLWAHLSLPASFAEFKYAWTENHPERRRAFFAACLRHEFRFAVATYDKLAVWGRRPDRADIFRCCAMSLAADLRPLYVAAEASLRRSRPGRTARLNEELILDRNGDKKLLVAVGAAFGELGTHSCGTREPNPLAGKPRFRDSAKNELLQLADMVCGAAGDRDRNSGEWFEMIRARCVGASRYPGTETGWADSPAHPVVS